MIAKGENVCEFVDTETQEVGVSSVYKVRRHIWSENCQIDVIGSFLETIAQPLTFNRF